MAAGVDGLRDHSLFFANKVLQNGGKADVVLMKEFVHGFCSMDTNAVGVHEFRRATLLTCGLFRQLFIEMSQKQGSKLYN